MLRNSSTFLVLKHSPSDQLILSKPDLFKDSSDITVASLRQYFPRKRRLSVGCATKVDLKESAESLNVRTAVAPLPN